VNCRQYRRGPERLARDDCPDAEGIPNVVEQVFNEGPYFWISCIKGRADRISRMFWFAHDVHFGPYSIIWTSVHFVLTVNNHTLLNVWGVTQYNMDSERRDKTDTNKIKHFLDKKWSFEILLEIGAVEPRQVDLRRGLEISPTTLSNRLQRGSEIGLWDQELESKGNGKTAKVYVLTKNGKFIYKIGRRCGLRKLYLAKQLLKMDIVNSKSEVFKLLNSGISEDELMDRWMNFSSKISELETELTLQRFTAFEDDPSRVRSSKEEMYD